MCTQIARHRLGSFVCFILICWLIASPIPARAGAPPEITRVAWSHSTERVARGDSTGHLVVQNGATGQRLWSVWAHNGPVSALAWSPDGRYLASGGDDGTVNVWNAASASPLQTFSSPYDDRPTSISRISDLAWNSTALAVLFSIGDGGRVLIYNPADGRLLWDLDGGSSGGIAFAPDDSRLAFANGEVDFFNFVTGQNERYQAEPLVSAVKLRYSPDGKYIAGGGGVMIGDFSIWAVATHALIVSRQDQTQTIVSVEWSPNGKYVASASLDGTLYIWDAATWLPARIIRSPRGKVLSVAWSPDSARIAYADGGSVPVIVQR